MENMSTPPLPPLLFGSVIFAGDSCPCVQYEPLAPSPTADRNQHNREDHRVRPRSARLLPSTASGNISFRDSHDRYILGGEGGGTSNGGGGGGGGERQLVVSDNADQQDSTVGADHAHQFVADDELWNETYFDNGGGGSGGGEDDDSNGDLFWGMAHSEDGYRTNVMANSRGFAGREEGVGIAAATENVGADR